MIIITAMVIMNIIKIIVIFLKILFNFLCNKNWVLKKKKIETTYLG